MKTMRAILPLLALAAGQISKAQDLLPSAPAPAAAIVAMHPAPRVSFMQDRTNRWLMAADLAVRMNDAVSTYVDLHSCQCKETGVLPEAVSENFAAVTAYSIGYSVTSDYAGSLLWKHGHRKLSRLVLLFDIGYDGEAGIRNWTLTNYHAPAIPAASGTISSRPIR